MIHSRGACSDAAPSADENQAFKKVRTHPFPHIIILHHLAYFTQISYFVILNGTINRALVRRLSFEHDPQLYFTPQPRLDCPCATLQQHGKRGAGAAGRRKSASFEI
jgi:hypothetical protein